MKTICQVLHSLNVGGAEVLAARIARALGHQYRFVFACLDELGPLGESLRAEGLRVEVVGRRPGVDFECMRRLARLLARRRRRCGASPSIHAVLLRPGRAAVAAQAADPFHRARPVVSGLPAPEAYPL